METNGQGDQIGRIGQFIILISFLKNTKVAQIFGLL
jgi:hypothetical protein